MCSFSCKSPRQILICWTKPSIPYSPMKEHPDIVKFCHFSAYVRTRSAGILRGLAPWHTDFGTKSSVLHLVRGVHALPVRTYTAIAPNASYRVTTKFAQSELDSAKQKAGYHRHGDTLPLLVYCSEQSFRRTSCTQKRTRTLFRKESGSSTNCLVEN